MILLLLLFLLTDPKQHLVRHSACKTPSGEAGRCVNVYECKSLLHLLNKPNRTSQDSTILKRSHCGFSQKMPKVCCPQPRPRPTSNHKKCTTPDGHEGKCIHVYSCPKIISLLPRQQNSKIRAYVLKSSCHENDPNIVCCATSSTKLVPVSQSPAFTPPVMSSELHSEQCGLDAGNGNRIVGGSEPTIDQYPWLVLIEYKKELNIILDCGGSLISRRYVLTAAHCVHKSFLKTTIPINVRLGEYDIKNSGPDCQIVDGGGKDCTNGTITIAIKEIIIHPNYNPYSRLRRNDIALIRLKQMAPYTDFIRPICLPTTNETVSMSPGVELYAAGWGLTANWYNNHSNIKMHVSLPYKPLKECQAVYIQSNLTLWKGQICAGGEQGKDSCKGDSGGPLMYENNGIYEVVGIVSFGPKPCGVHNVPSVYTKVHEYLPWIRSQMKS